MGSVDQRQLGGYLEALTHRQRVVGVFRDQQLVGWVTYFLCDTLGEAHAFHERSFWTVPLDSPTGVLCYLDKMVSSAGWTRAMRQQVESMIRAQHSQLETAVWFRATAGPDRMVQRRLGARYAEV